MPIVRSSKDATFDYQNRLKDAGLVAVSAAAQVASTNKIIDVGLGRLDARVLIDTIAVEVDTGNERYRIIVQGSNSATFASGVFNLGDMQFGHSSTTLESASSVAASRAELAFTNEKNGVLYRYIRLYTEVAGTVATGINYTANLIPEA